MVKRFTLLLIVLTFLTTSKNMAQQPFGKEPLRPYLFHRSHGS